MQPTNIVSTSIASTRQLCSLLGTADGLDVAREAVQRHTQGIFIMVHEL